MHPVWKCLIKSPKSNFGLNRSRVAISHTNQHLARALFAISATTTGQAQQVRLVRPSPPNPTPRQPTHIQASTAATPGTMAAGVHATSRKQTARRVDGCGPGPYVAESGQIPPHREGHIGGATTGGCHMGWVTWGGCHMGWAIWGRCHIGKNSRN
eukprot:COSAG02_NODE_1762_length_11027_cov_27.491947_6_plen_155_part_00